MRAYVPEMPKAYSQVLHPDATGATLVTTDSTSSGASSAVTDWNHSWLAINNPSTNAGVLILRDSATANAQILLEDDGNADSSAVDLLKPVGGWMQAVTETEWLCFYDATSWPVMSRSASSLPAGCRAVSVPIDRASPTISGNAMVGATLSGSAGTWAPAGAFTYQWNRCTSGTCTPIAGATNATYAVVPDDEGLQLRLDVTAMAICGEADTASSAPSDGVKPGSVPPQNIGLPLVAGEAREGQTLTGTPGNWSDAPGGFTFQWERCASASGTACVDIVGAASRSYLVSHADIGSTLRLRVSARNANGVNAAESAPTAVVKKVALVATFTVSPTPTGGGRPAEAEDYDYLSIEPPRPSSVSIASTSWSRSRRSTRLR
jgi:hypothetical protein